MKREIHYQMETASNVASFLFQQFGWTWEDNKVPSYGEIFKAYEKLLEVSKDEDFAESGRLGVRQEKDNSFVFYVVLS